MSTTTFRDNAGWNEIGVPQRQETPRAKTLNPEDLSLAESNRQRRRESIRERLAIAEMSDRQRLEAVEAINWVNSQKEAISASHVAECAPLQRRLAEIEQIQIASIKARIDGDPAIEVERRELLAELREKNATLESAIQHQDSLLQQLEAERLDAAKRCGYSTLQTELIASGRPDLVAKMRVTSNSLNWSNARLNKAEEVFLQKRDAYTLAELDAARAAVVNAEREAAEALADVLAE